MLLQMEQSAQVTRLAHIRMVGLLTTLWILDALMLLFAIESIMLEGPTVMIMFASEVRFCSSGSFGTAGADFRPSHPLLDST